MPASAVANLCTRCSACRHAISSRWRSAAALRVRTQVSSRAADTSGQMCWHLHSAVTWPPGRRVPRRHRILMCRCRWQWYRPCHGSNQRQRSTDGAARAVLLRQIFVNSNRACHRVFGAAEEPVRRPCISRWNRSSSSAATPRVPNASTRPPASSIAKGILSRLWHISATTGASASLSLKQRCRRPRGRQTIARPGRSAPALRSARAMGQAPRVPAGDTRLRLHSRLIAGMSIRAASRRICSTRTAVELMACSQQSSTISMHWLARNAAMLGAAAQLSPNRNPVSPSPDWRCRWRCFG